MKKYYWLIAIIGFLVYFRILFNGFVWDDTTYILGNQELQGFNIVKLVGPNMFNSSGYFRPIPAIYFSFLSHLFENSAFFFHFVQLSLHILCTILLFKLFQKYFSPKLSLFLSLVFLVHPINVESVAYIGSTQSQLYFLFGTLALLSVDYLKSHAYLLLALFTKEVGFLYFILIYLKKYVENISIQKKYIFTSVISILIYLTIRISSLGHIAQKMHLIPISEIPLFHRLMHIPQLHFYYLKTFFYPKVLAIDQIWVIKHFNFTNFYLPLLLVSIFYLLLAGYLIYLVKTKNKLAKIFAFFFVWYLLGIAMLSQVFPLDMTVADRWFYFPIVGLLGMLGVISSKIKFKNIILLFTINYLLLLSIRTFVRTGDWQSALTLYSKDAGVFENYDLENYLGFELAAAGRREEALIRFHRAVELLPHDTNLYNLGSMYEQLGNREKALEYYEKAVTVKDKYLNHVQIRELAYVGMGRILVLDKQYKQVSDLLNHALITHSENGTLWSFLAISEYHLGNQEKALEAAKNAIKYLPNPTTQKLYNLILNQKEINLKLD